MSDDTPTQRFDGPGGDLPTQRMDAAGAADPAPSGDDEGKSKRLIIILSSVGGALLVALIILLVVLLNRGSGGPTAEETTGPSQTSSESPSASPTPSQTPTPSETEETPPPPPPPSNDVEITMFTATQEVDCSNQTNNPEFVEFTWESTNGIAAFFGVGTNDAQAAGMGWTLPPNGNTNDFPSGYAPYEYQCFQPEITYTLTIVGTNGSKDTQKVTVINVGDTSS